MAERRLWAMREATSRSIRSLPEMAGGMKVMETFGSNTFNADAARCAGVWSERSEDPQQSRSAHSFG